MLSAMILDAIVIDPSLNVHEIGNERWHFALQDGGIAPDGIVGFTVRLIELIHNCNGGPERTM